MFFINLWFMSERNCPFHPVQWESGKMSQKSDESQSMRTCHLYMSFYTCRLQCVSKVTYNKDNSMAWNGTATCVQHQAVCWHDQWVASINDGTGSSITNPRLPTQLQSSLPIPPTQLTTKREYSKQQKWTWWQSLFSPDSWLGSVSLLQRILDDQVC